MAGSSAGFDAVDEKFKVSVPVMSCGKLTGRNNATVPCCPAVSEDGVNTNVGAGGT